LISSIGESGAFVSINTVHIPSTGTNAKTRRGWVGGYATKLQYGFQTPVPYLGINMCEKPKEGKIKYVKEMEKEGRWKENKKAKGKREQLGKKIRKRHLCR
jgi:hypothetical protein